MTESYDDEELAARLRAADPASTLPPAAPEGVARLLEETMSHDVLTESRNGNLEVHLPRFRLSDGFGGRPIDAKSQCDCPQREDHRRSKSCRLDPHRSSKLLTRRDGRWA